MRKNLLCFVSAIIMASLVSGCSPSNRLTPMDANSASNVTLTTTVLQENESDSIASKNEKGDGTNVYSFNAGQQQVLVVKTDKNDDLYKGCYALKVGNSTAQLATPAVDNIGIKLSENYEESFKVLSVTDGTNNYYIVIFLSDNSLETVFATCYYVDENGINILGGNNQFPTCDGNIEVDGMSISFGSEKYTVNTEKRILE